MWFSHRLSSIKDNIYWKLWKKHIALLSQFLSRVYYWKETPPLSLFSEFFFRKNFWKNNFSYMLNKINNTKLCTKLNEWLTDNILVYICIPTKNVDRIERICSKNWTLTWFDWYFKWQLITLIFLMKLKHDLYLYRRRKKTHNSECTKRRFR